MKKAFILAGFLLAIPSFASSGDGLRDAQEIDGGSLHYRASSSAIVLEGPAQALRLKEIVTAEGKGFLAVHEIEDEGPASDCPWGLWPDAMEQTR